MEDLNEPQEQSPAPDFENELKQAQQTGDYDYVIETAKKSHRMLVDFRDCIKAASFAGKDAPAVSMGLNFIENMISNSAGQINALKQTEKQTREAVKAALKAQKAPGESVEPAGAPAVVPVPPAAQAPGAA